MKRETIIVQLGQIGLTACSSKIMKEVIAKVVWHYSIALLT